MIFEAIIGIFAALAKGIAALFGSLPAPDWLTSAGSALTSMLSVGSGLDAWIPWNLLLSVTGAVLACMATSFAVKLVRIILSLFTGGGGSAA